MFSIFKRKHVQNHLNFNIIKIEEDKELIEKPNNLCYLITISNIKEEKIQFQEQKYKLPDINYLEKNLQIQIE